jgi:succinyl-diaminopimelate desuccinylase
VQSPLSRIRERLVEATVELLSIPSVTGAERELAHHFERWALGQPHISRDDVIRTGNNLVIGQPDGHRPCLALVGHLDTVPPHSSDGPVRIDGRRVYGRGASDMKGGLAVMQTLVENLDLDRLPFCLLLLLYDREEGPYVESGLGLLLEQLDFLGDIDLALALEPTDNTLQLGCLGALHARVTFHGRAAHSARPWEGENAIHKAAPLLTRLLATPPRPVEISGMVFRETISATVASGGSTRNVIPDRFELNLNYRFAPGADANACSAAAAQTVRAMAPEAEVEILDVAPPGPVPTDNPVFDHVRRLSAVAIGAKEAWTDVGRLAAHDIDAVNFGPGAPSQAHQAGEWIEAEALTRSYETLHRVLSTPLSG